MGGGPHEVRWRGRRGVWRCSAVKVCAPGCARQSRRASHASTTPPPAYDRSTSPYRGGSKAPTLHIALKYANITGTCKFGKNAKFALIREKSGGRSPYSSVPSRLLRRRQRTAVTPTA